MIDDVYHNQLRWASRCPQLLIRPGAAPSRETAETLVESRRILAAELDVDFKSTSCDAWPKRGKSDDLRKAHQGATNRAGAHPAAAGRSCPCRFHLSLQDRE